MGTQIIGGVDTHLEVHVAAALDDHGNLLGTASFATTADGYRDLAEWLGSFGDVVLVGVEGTGSYGTGLTRSLQADGINVVEVDRPNRQRRRRAGKSDTHDAVSAARAAFAGDALGAPKTRAGNVEAIRVLRLARTGATRDRTRALNQMRSLVITAPDELRSQLRGLKIPNLVRTAAAFRPAGRPDVTSANRVVFKTLARRILELDDEIRALDALLTPLVAQTAPELIERLGVGTDTAGALLVAAGGNSHRIRNERSFARLCGAAPLDASSAKQQRHRLSRSGDRQANSALWRIVITRLSYDPTTRRYLQRRCAQGKTKPEAIRCLKRYIARELYTCLPQQRLLDRTQEHQSVRVTRVPVLALLLLVPVGACSGGGHASDRSNGTVRLAAAAPALARECRIASHSLGFAVPCPTRAVTRSGHPLACRPSPIPTSLPLCVGPEHDFFLEWNGFDVPSSFVGVGGKPLGHVIISAALVRDSPARPCIGGVLVGMFVVLGSRSTVYRCPPDSPLIERTARHGEGAYTSHVLLAWQTKGIEYLVSSHGYGTASVTLMEQLAASLKLVTA